MGEISLTLHIFEGELIFVPKQAQKCPVWRRQIPQQIATAMCKKNASFCDCTRSVFKDLHNFYSFRVFFFSSSSSRTLSPHRFPTTDNFQWPQQSLEILRQYLLVEVSGLSSSMKCLWNSAVFLSSVCSQRRCNLAGVRGWWYACRITIVTPVTWSEANLSSGGFCEREERFSSRRSWRTCLLLTLNPGPDFTGQVRFLLVHCP